MTLIVPRSTMLPAMADLYLSPTKKRVRSASHIDMPSEMGETERKNLHPFRQPHFHLHPMTNTGDSQSKVVFERRYRVYLHPATPPYDTVRVFQWSILSWIIVEGQHTAQIIAVTSRSEKTPIHGGSVVRLNVVCCA